MVRGGTRVEMSTFEVEGERSSDFMGREGLALRTGK